MSNASRSLLDNTERNRAAIKTLVVPQALSAAVVVGLVVGLLVTWWLGVIAALVAGVAIAVLLPRSVPTGLGSIIESSPTTEDDYPRYHNLMDGLSISSGAATPSLHVLDDPSLNLAVYGPPDSAVVVATAGLLDSLDRVELEGVLAEALARIRSHDAELGSQAAVMVCGPMLRNGPARSGRPMWYVSLFAAARAKRLRRLLGEHRDFLSDLAAVDITRYPPGLGAALERMQREGTAVESATWGTAHLWLANPLGPPPDGASDAATMQRLNELFESDAPISQRASLMAEL